jgi:phosphate transport system substrate-binding protein
LHRQADCAKGQKVINFVKWAYGDGTKFATDLLYVPLPDAVKNKVLVKLGQVTGNGKTL